jgi:protein phosphatase 2C-like protein
MRPVFSLLSAVTAPAQAVNEDAYGVYPDRESPCAVWVLDGVTGLNDRALLPGPTDAAWFVAQVQEILPALLSHEVERPIPALVRALAARQAEAWLDTRGADDSETPAASFAMVRMLDDEIEITRLGDCSVLVERQNGFVDVLRNAALERLELKIKQTIVELRVNGLEDLAEIQSRLLPALRAQRLRRNHAGGYGVLAPEPECLDLLRIERMPAAGVRRILLVSDGFYRLVDVYGTLRDAELIRRTEEQGADGLLAELRAIEAADPNGARYPRLKLGDDATAVLLRVADAGSSSSSLPPSPPGK